MESVGLSQRKHMAQNLACEFHFFMYYYSSSYGYVIYSIDMPFLFYKRYIYIYIYSIDMQFFIHQQTNF